MLRIPDKCVTESVVTSVFGDQFNKYTFADRVILSVLGKLLCKSN